MVLERLLSSNDDDTLSSETTSTILSTLEISLGVGFLLMAVFEMMRGLVPIYCKRLRSLPHRTPPPPSMSPLGWVSPTLSVGDQETLRMVGLDGYILLRYIRLCYRTFFFCSMWGLIVLVPLYVSQGTVVTDDNTLYIYTMANLESGSNVLWAPTVFAYVFSGYFMYLLRIDYRRFMALRQNFLADGDESFPQQALYSVMLENIPASYRSPAALKAFFESMFPGQVHSAIVCLDLTVLEKVVRLREKIRNELERAIAEKEATGDEPKIFVTDKGQSGLVGHLCGQRHDKIPYLRERLRELNDEVSIRQEELRIGQEKMDKMERERLGEADTRGVRVIGDLVAGISTVLPSLKRSMLNPKLTPLLAADSLGEMALTPESSPLKPSESPAIQLQEEQASEEKKDIPFSVDRSSSASGGHKPNTSSGQKVLDALSTVGNIGVGLGTGFGKQAIGNIRVMTHGAIKGVKAVTRQIEILTVGSDYRLSSTGFVTFTSRVACAAAMQMLLTPEALHLTVKQGPPVSGIIWKNVFLPQPQINSRTNISNAGFVAGAVFWSVIVAAIQGWASITSLSATFPILKDYEGTYLYTVLSGYLPVIALLILLSLLPIIFQAVATNYDGLKTEFEIQGYIMKRYFYYQVANIYVTVTAGSIYESINNLWNSNATAVITQLANALPTVSVYFINIVIVKILVVLPLILLRLWPLTRLTFARVVMNRRRLTRRDLRVGIFSDPMIYYGWEYPTLLMVLMIGLTYSVITPFLLPLAAAFFGLAYVVYKYQLLYVYVPKYESGGSHWYAVYSRSVVSLLAAQITTIGYMALKEGVTQAPCLLPLPFITLYWWSYTESSFVPPSEYISLNKAVDIDQDQGGRAIAGDGGVFASEFDENFYRQYALVEPTQQPEEYRLSADALESALAHRVFHDEDIELSTGNNSFDASKSLLSNDANRDSAPGSYNDPIPDPILDPNTNTARNRGLGGAGRTGSVRTVYGTADVDTT